MFVSLLLCVFQFVSMPASAHNIAVTSAGKWQGFLPVTPDGQSGFHDALVDQTIGTTATKTEVDGSGYLIGTGGVSFSANICRIEGSGSYTTVEVDVAAKADSRLGMWYADLGPYSIGNNAKFDFISDSSLEVISTTTTLDDCGWWLNVVDKDNNPWHIGYMGGFYNHVWVCTNGFVAFDAAASNDVGAWVSGTPAPIGSPELPNSLVAPLWRNLYMDKDSKIVYGPGSFTKMINAGCFIIGWINMRDWTDPQVRLSFAVYFYHSSALDDYYSQHDDIEFVYKSYTALDGTVIGIEDEAGGMGDYILPTNVSKGKYFQIYAAFGGWYRIKEIEIGCFKFVSDATSSASFGSTGSGWTFGGMNIGEYIYNNPDNDGVFDTLDSIQDGLDWFSAGTTVVELMVGCQLVPGWGQGLIAGYFIAHSIIDLLHTQTPSNSEQGIDPMEPDTMSGTMTSPCKDDLVGDVPVDPYKQVYPWTASLVSRIRWSILDTSVDHTIGLYAKVTFVDRSGKTYPLSTPMDVVSCPTLTLFGTETTKNGNGLTSGEIPWAARTSPDMKRYNFYPYNYGGAVACSLSTDGTTESGYDVMGWSRLADYPALDYTTGADGWVRIEGDFMQIDSLPPHLVSSERMVNIYVMYSPPSDVSYSGELEVIARTARILDADDSVGSWVHASVDIGPFDPNRHIKVGVGRPASSDTSEGVGVDWVNVQVTPIPAPPSPNQKPTAYINSVAPNPASYGTVVTLDGWGSDPDGSVVAFHWWSSIDGDLYLGPQNVYQTSDLSVGDHIIKYWVQDDDGAWSDEWVLSVSSVKITQGDAPTKPGAPQWPSASERDGDFTLSWDPAIDDGPTPLDHYVLQEMVIGGGWVTLSDNIPKNPPQYSPGYRSPGTYYYQVKGVDTGGLSGPWSDLSDPCTVPWDMSVMRSDGAENSPAIAADLSGNYHVAWAQLVGGKNVICYALLDPNWNILSGPTQLTTTAYDSIEPVIAFSPSKGVKVVWSDNSATNYQIRSVVMEPGAVIVNEWRVKGYNCREPDIAVDSDGGFHIVFKDSKVASDKRHVTEEIRWIGPGQYDRETLYSYYFDYVTGASRNHLESPKVAVGTGNIVHVAFARQFPVVASPAEVVYTRISGGVWPEPWAIASMIDAPWDVSIDADWSSNYVCVVYENWAGASYMDIQFTISPDGGITWPGAPSHSGTLAGSRQKYESGPDASFSADGKVYVVWNSDYGTEGHEVYYAVSTDHGLTWSLRTQVSQGSGDSLFPRICISALGEVGVVWQDARNNSDWDIYFTAKFFS